MLYRYKPEEGRNARQIAFWLGAAFLAYGCLSLRTWLDRISALRGPVTTGITEVPLLGGTLSPSFLIALGVFVVGLWAWISYLSRVKPVDFLIGTESEMRKVTWPSFKEASNSAVIVIGTVLLLSGFMALADFVLGGLFKIILWNR